MTPLNKIDIKKYSNIFVFSITLIPLILFLFVVWNRISLPFVFEWGESAGVDQINRILAGSKIYTQPALDFAPLVYTPLYYYLAAGVSALIGNSLLSARLVSFVAAILSVILINRLVYKETKNQLIAWISGTAYLSCFALSSGFFDLARVDSVYVLMVLITFIAIQEAKDRLGYLAGGLLLAIGFFIKQSFIIVFFPLLIYLFLERKNQFWLTITAGFAGTVIPVILINRFSDNWFLYYIFELPKEHGYSFVSALNFWIGDTLKPLGLFITFSFLFLFAYKILKGQLIPFSGENGIQISYKQSRERWWVYVLFFAGAAAASWITRSSNGGGANNVMVFYAVLAIGLGLGTSLIMTTKWVRENPWNYAFVLLIISIQFIGLFYNPYNFLPKEDEIRASEELGDRVRGSGKQVLIPYQSHLSELYGLEPQIHIASLFELTGYFKGEIQTAGYILVDQIRTNICWQEYGLIVLDQPVPWFDRQLEQAYLQDPATKMIDIEQSELLEWRQGYQRTYIPLMEYNRENCLESISIGQ